MSKFSERFKHLRKQHNLSQQDLANQLGYTKSRVNMYERGEREPSYEVLEEIADYFNVDMDYLHGKSDIPNRNEWLKTINAAASRGERIRVAREAKQMTQEELGRICGTTKQTIYKYETGAITNIPLDKLESIAKALDVSSSYLAMWDDSFMPDNIIQMPGKSSIPLVGTIACGTPILAEENREGDVDLPEHIRADFALRCKGDSMINARIFDGDIVYIRQQDRVERGEIAAVLIGTEATLKRVKTFDDHIILEAENPQYRPMVYWGDEMNDVRILGKAVAFTSTVR